MEGDCVSGTIDVLDVRFGSLWTNIPRELFSAGPEARQPRRGDITNDTRTLYKNIMAYARSFADVNVGEPLLYVNSLDCVAVAINQAAFPRRTTSAPASPGAFRCARPRRIVYE